MASLRRTSTATPTENGAPPPLDLLFHLPKKTTGEQAGYGHAASEQDVTNTDVRLLGGMRVTREAPGWDNYNKWRETNTRTRPENGSNPSLGTVALPPRARALSGSMDAQKHTDSRLRSCENLHVPCPPIESIKPCVGNAPKSCRTDRTSSNRERGDAPWRKPRWRRTRCMRSKSSRIVGD